uniref:Uncharacterized protein n=1 Tax=Anguilla anguilla TaxID=7936 RepID=A0A0E9WLI9_ANGAN
MIAKIHRCATSLYAVYHIHHLGKYVHQRDRPLGRQYLSFFFWTLFKFSIASHTRFVKLVSAALKKRMEVSLIRTSSVIV